MELEAFLDDWLNRTGGAERSNAQPFLIALCHVLGVSPPRPAAAGGHDNDYVFERSVRRWTSENETTFGRIDLYKRGAFLLEAKQSVRLVKDFSSDGPAQASLQEPEADRPGRRSISRGWDSLMRSAREQARRYVFDLPAEHPAPPFLIVCDVGHVLEVYADFTGTGRDYTYFPDRRSYRIYLEDLRDLQIRARLRAIWDDPGSLDPARRKHLATREIAGRLTAVTVALEARGIAREDVALFLMRCIFTMFACSVGLLPEFGFVDLLNDCVENPQGFQPLVRELWVKMNDPLPEARYFPPFHVHVPYFGGKLFKSSIAYSLPKELILALLRAAQCSWAEVEPAIFGGLLEDALDPLERRRLGAHYTPRRHVERLVHATIMETLREDWRKVMTAVEHARDAGDLAHAQQLVGDFHARLCRTRVLDPACGTGNFLYIALEAMKTLEAEVLETLAQLGAPERLALEGVDPRQFLGLEVNEGAVPIAELVLWIGYLQLHYRTHTGHPAEPILQAFGTIVHRDAVLTWQGDASVGISDAMTPQGPPPRRPDWPEAEFIVGNPPFIGGKDLRTRLGDAQAEALWAAHPQMNRAADLVMYWWDHAAELLTREGAALRRFGFVTTNSITQPHQRLTLKRHLSGPSPLHLTYAVPDQPWTRASARTAAVRVAITVAGAGAGQGDLLELISEAALDSDEPQLKFRRTQGRINSDLSIGLDLTRARPLLANRGLCSPGVKLHGAGFIVTLGQAQALGLGRRAGLEAYIRPYRNGRDIVQQPRDALVIDLYPLPADQVRARFPEVYQHLLATVKPHRDINRMSFRRDHWWWFGATHEMYRSFTEGLARYIATPETAKHRIFVFLPSGTRADNMLVTFGTADAFHLGVLSSRPHLLWARATGSVLEDRPRYTKSACFDLFPFPDPTDSLRRDIGRIAEEIDATRALVQSEHPDLTLTALYNAIASFNTAAAPGFAAMARGRVLILRELHARLDALAMQSYSWPPDLATQDVLAKLAELNAIRREEEKAGDVRWLRPDYQTSRFAPRAPATRLEQEKTPRLVAAAAPAPLFPRDRSAQPFAVLQMLETLGRPQSTLELAQGFRRRVPGIDEKIKSALVTLARYGRITVLPDGRYLARRAA